MRRVRSSSACSLVSPCITASGPTCSTIVGVGLCGGYTTWSTSSWETVHLVHTGHRAEAIVYTVGSLVVCIGAAAAGIGIVGLL